MKREQVSALLIASFMVYTNGGCASLSRGSYQSIGLTSDPGGAYVKVDGVDKGSTPMVIKMRRKWSHTVQFDKEGYKTHEASIISESGGWICNRGSLVLLPPKTQLHLQVVNLTPLRASYRLHRSGILAGAQR